MRLVQNFTILAVFCFILMACGESDIRETTYYNGIRATQVAYKDGKPNGEYKSWTSHGDLAETGEYKDGLREGDWTSFFSDGRIQALKHYKAGKKEGTWTAFYFDGQIAWKHDYKEDEHIGEWTSYYQSGILREKTSCFLHTNEGMRQEFYPDGKLKISAHCKNGLLNGTQETYYTNGALETRSEYLDERLNGKFELYRATGTLWRISYYKMGVRDSDWTYFAKDGSVERKSHFENGNGIAYGEIGENGIDAETTFVANQIQDTIRYKLLKHASLQYAEIWEKGEKIKLLSYYEPSGNLASEGNFANGKRNGFWRNWYLNGKIKDSLFYKNDSLFGEQLYYDSTGALYMRKNQYGKNAVEVKFE